MPHANELHDDDRYEYVPAMVSPVSDDPCNPDSVRICEPMPEGTVKTVSAPHARGNRETY